MISIRAIANQSMILLLTLLHNPLPPRWNIKYPVLCARLAWISWATVLFIKNKLSLILTIS